MKILVQGPKGSLPGASEPAYATLLHDWLRRMNVSCPLNVLGACTEEQATVPGLHFESVIIFYFIEKLRFQPKVSSKLTAIFVDDFQDPNNTIIQNIMKTFHKAMKIRKYLRLSKNSLILSPVVGSRDSSPNPSVSLFLSLKLSTAPAFTSSVPQSSRSPIMAAETAAETERAGARRGRGSACAFPVPSPLSPFRP